MTDDAKANPVQFVIDEESGWPVRDNESDAMLDAIALGRGFYRVPIEALASRDPGRVHDKPLTLNDVSDRV